jgi:hypothetical protein
MARRQPRDESNTRISINVNARHIVQYVVVFTLTNGTRGERWLPLGAQWLRATAEANLIRECHPGRVSRLEVRTTAVNAGEGDPTQLETRMYGT